MYLIVGLGNPTSQYENTRHNVGFDAVDYLARENGISITTKKHQALIGKGIIAGHKTLLSKPQTFMNLSGDSIWRIVDYYNLDIASQLLVIYDDISLDVGRLRIRAKGSAGGHNGIKSIINCLGTQEFCRIKIGVGEKPNRMDLADYVLGHFSKEERSCIDKALERAAKAAELIACGEINQAMNQYNG